MKKKETKKQVEKLFAFVAAPRVYNINPTTRVYKTLCKLATGVEAVRTGHSERRTKWIITKDVCEVLVALKIGHTAENIAPRGGADGERVALYPEVREVLVQLFEAFKASYVASLPARKRKNARESDIEKAYINTLRRRA